MVRVFSLTPSPSEASHGTRVPRAQYSGCAWTTLGTWIWGLREPCALTKPLEPFGHGELLQIPHLLDFFGGKRASLPYIYHYLLSNMALWRWEQPGRTKIRKIMVDRSQQHSRLRGFFGRDVLWWKSSASAAKIDWGPSSVGCCVGMATWTEPNFGASKIQRS